MWRMHEGFGVANKQVWLSSLDYLTIKDGKHATVDFSSGEERKIKKQATKGFCSKKTKVSVKMQKG